MDVDDNYSGTDDASTAASSTVSSSGSELSFLEDLCIASLCLSSRANRLIVMRMNWDQHVQSLLHENLFHVKYRMTLPSFNKLLSFLRPSLQLNDKYAKMSGFEPICCELMLHCCIRYLAGGSYHDIRATAAISKASFYRLVWHTIHCINRCTALDVKLPTEQHELQELCEGLNQISRDAVMDGCIGAVDGYLLQITAPSFGECGNVTAYFSGHYCTYGVNVQAMCDADCRFLFFCIAAPGKTNDAVAIRKTSLLPWLDALPPGFFVAGDCAYTLTEHMITPYSGPQRYLAKCDNFNFFLSQLRIRIEMAYGLMVTKWSILHTPINTKLSNLKFLLDAICRLHNFCINNREASVQLRSLYRVHRSKTHPHEPTKLGYIPSDAPTVVSREGTSHLREILANRVASNSLVRPVTSVMKKTLEQTRSAMYEAR